MKMEVERTLGVGLKAWAQREAHSTKAQYPMADTTRALILAKLFDKLDWARENVLGSSIA